MKTKTIRAGETVFANGSLATGDLLDIQAGPVGGGAGAIAVVTTFLVNAGTISIEGGASTSRSEAGGQGALLDVLGVLTDSGLIHIIGGQVSSTARMLMVSAMVQAARSWSPACRTPPRKSRSPAGQALPREDNIPADLAACWSMPEALRWQAG